MAVLFVEYPKCSTCKKAKAWLDEHGVEYIAVSYTHLAAKLMLLKY